MSKVVKWKNLLVFSLIISTFVLVASTITACNNNPSSINFLDEKIAASIGLYDENGNSKILQEYTFNNENKVNFRIGTDLSECYNLIFDNVLGFNNIDFRNLVDHAYRPLPGTKPFLINALHLKLDSKNNDQVIGGFEAFYWKPFDGKNHPTFGLKTLKYEPKFSNITQRYDYYSKGYEHWHVNMPKTTATLAIIDQTNSQAKVISQFQVKVNNNDLLLGNNGQLLINPQDITFTKNFHSKKHLTAKTFNSSIHWSDNISEIATVAKNLATLLKLPITFRICMINEGNNSIFLVPNVDYAAVSGNVKYSIAMFIGKVLIRYDLWINFR